MENTTETWKPVAEYPHLGVSNTGLLRSNKYKSSKLVGTNPSNPRLYRMVIVPCVAGARGEKGLLIHRLVAKAFLTPVEGKECIDHINGDKHDNRVENLRWVDKAENNANRNKSKEGSKSRYVGVSWDAKRQMWRATIMLNKKNKYLGCYTTEEDARDAYLAARMSAHGV